MKHHRSTNVSRFRPWRRRVSLAPQPVLLALLLVAFVCAPGLESVVHAQEQDTSTNSAAVACANLKNAGSTVVAQGYVVGPGPYFLLPLLDDFGAGAAAGLPPGALTALDLTGATPTIPASSKTSYALDAYVVSQTLSLTTAIPRPTGPADTLTCP